MSDDLEFREGAKAELKEGIQGRIEEGEWEGDAVSVLLLDNVNFFWDKWSDPLIEIHHESPYYEYKADVRDLSDYGEHGDTIAEFVDDAFGTVDRHPTGWELDKGDTFHDFYAYGVMEEEH